MPSEECESKDACATDEQAVGGEWAEGAGPEVAHQIAHREVRRDAGDKHAHDDLTVDVRSGLSEERGQFEDAGSEDRRRGEQEREAGGVLVVTPRHSPPTIVTPERLIPGSSASTCSSPTDTPSRLGSREMRESDA